MGAIQRKLSRLNRGLRERGIGKTTRLLWESFVIEFNSEFVRAFRDRLFDRKYHVETAGFKTLDELGLNDSAGGSHNYRGTPVALFDLALGELRLDWSRFEFVDYGSGLGKALLLAARFPFRRVTGVEFSPELHAVAQRNLAQWRLPRQRCSDVRAVLADASTWPIPEGDCLLYFFNPFREVLLRLVLSHIVQSVGTGRDVYIVYLHPSFPKVFAEFPQLKAVVQVTLRHRLYSIYKVEVGPAQGQ